ncbi:MAG: tetratricopeptide repeat protein [Acidobacteria bacterium]|nr:tetratricopeptide repeat protein [Acidobacteriota bacterium]
MSVTVPSAPAARDLVDGNQGYCRCSPRFEHALRLAPDSAEALNGLVAIDLESNQPAAALARVAAHTRDGASASMLMVAARAHLSTGDLGTAERLLRRVADKDPTDASAYSLLSHVYVRQGRIDAALSTLDTLLERDPKSVESLTAAG